MSGRAWTAVAVGASVLAAVVSTWPLASVMTHAVPTMHPECLGHGCEDDFLCVWIVTSLAKNLLRAPQALFEGDILFPLRHTLAYSETMLTAVVLTAPITWLTGNHVLAYDLHYLATVALSVLGTYLLVRDVTGDPRAALVAGLLYGLANERWLVRGHLAKLSIQWVPFVFWTWLRMLERPSPRRAFAAAAAMLANLHAGVYQGLLLPLPLTAWAAVLIGARGWPLRRWVASAVVLGSALGLGLLLYYPFVVVREEMSLVTPGMIEVPGALSWYVLPFADPLGYLRRYGAPERWSLGLTPLPAVALVAAVVMAILRSPREPRPSRERAHLLAMAAFMLVSAALTVRPDRLGPFEPAMDAIFRLPGFDGLRGRNRAAIFVTFGATTLFGIALATILRRLRRGMPAALLVLAAIAAVVVDTRTLHEPTPVTTLPAKGELPPALNRAIAADPHGGLLHLPYGHWPEEVRYMMWGLHHERPIMNGYTAVMPRFSRIVRALPSQAARDALSEAGITHVLVHAGTMRALGDTGTLDRIRAAKDLPQRSIDDAILVTLAGAPPVALPPEGRPLAREEWRLEASDPDAARAVDGDVATHWTAVTIDRETFLRVDLGAEHDVTGVRLELGPHLREYPHAWELRGSRDGASWSVLGHEEPTRPPFASYRRDHRAIVLDLPVAPASVRILELRVPPQPFLSVFGSHANGTWGVHELVVLARSPADAR